MIKITLIFISIFTNNIFAIPAYPGLINLTQPSGETFTAYIKGDEWQNWYETKAGYTISKNIKNEWVYVESFNNNSYELTNILVNDKLNDQLNNIEKHIKPNRKIIEPLNNIPKINFSSRESFKIPMLLIEFPDLTSINSVNQFNNMMNLENYESSQGETGSFYDYFQEVSYGQFIPSTDVMGWYMANESYTVYGDGAPDGYNMVRIMIRDAVNEACTNGVDWSIYDNDNNGYVDALNIVHAGAGAEEGNSSYIWSHSWQLGNYATECNGVTINNYVIQPERTTMGTGGMVHIGVFAHEFGHALGVPDLYDTDYSSPGVGNWCLMSGGSWGGNGGSPWYPVHMSAWIKYQLGWISPISIDEPIVNYDIENVQENPIVFRMDGIDNTNEYYLFENRQKILYDQNLPHQGLLIWHVDESQNSNQNDWNRLVDLEQADGFYNLNYNINSGDPGDPYPGSFNNNNFTFDTQPNSTFNNDNPSGVSVVNIEQNENIISATFRNIPTLTINNLNVQETEGDNDQILNPGESGSISTELFNPSNQVISNLYAIPQNNNDYISINVDEITYPILYEFETVESNDLINIYVSPDTPIGIHSFDLYVFGDLENGTFEQTIKIDVNINVLQYGFPIEINTEVVSSPLFIESGLGIENSSILFCDNQGYVYLIDNQGNFIWETPFYTGNDIWGAPSAADIDNDQEIEFVVTSKSKQVYIIDKDGNQEASFNANQFLTATPTIGNFDSDENLEIVFGSMSNEGKVFVINHNGTLADGFPLEINEKIWVGAAAFDVDNDNIDEILITTDSGNLYLINDDGSINDNFTISTGYNIRSAPSVAFFNNNHNHLIFFGNDNGDFYCINQQGNIEFILNVNFPIRSTPSILEYNNNTYIFFTSDNNLIHGIDINGLYIPGWPIQINSNIKSSCSFADLNFDNIPEIIFSSKDGAINVIQLDGSPYENFPMDLNRNIENTPIIYDIDNDQDLEIITGDSKGLSIIDIKVNGQVLPWNIYRSNSYRNGTYNILETELCLEQNLGDINCDLSLDISDIIIIVNIILDQILASGTQLTISDMDSNNLIDILDVLIIINLILE